MSILLMSQVWKKDLDHVEQAILLAMADFADDDGYHCYPSQERIAWKSGYTERHVNTGIQRLVAKKYLRILAKSRQHAATHYQICLDAIPNKPPFVPSQRAQSVDARDEICAFRDEEISSLSDGKSDVRDEICASRDEISSSRDEMASPNPSVNHHIDPEKEKIDRSKRATDAPAAKPKRVKAEKSAEPEKAQAVSTLAESALGSEAQTAGAAAALPVRWFAWQFDDALNTRAIQALAGEWTEEQLLIILDASDKATTSRTRYLMGCLAKAPPKPKQALNPRSSYRPEDYTPLVLGTQPAYSAPDVREQEPLAQEYQGYDYNFETPVDVPSPMPMPPMPPMGDDLDSIWARCQYGFIDQDSQLAGLVKGSVLESTSELEEGKPVFHLVVAHPAQVQWLNAHTFAIRRSLSVEMKKPVVVKVVTPEAMAVDAFTRKVAVAT